MLYARRKEEELNSLVVLLDTLADIHNKPAEAVEGIDLFKER